MVRRPRHVLPLLAAILAAVLVLGPARADDAPLDRGALDKGIEKARGLLGRDQCEKGLALVQDLLDAHARRDYVLARRVELEDLVRRLAFGAKHPAPKPKDLVSGKLIRYVPQSGKIRIQYAPDREGDLESQGDGVLAFPARMNGPFSVTLEGDELPPAIEDSPQLIVGNEVDPKSGQRQLWILVAGSPKRIDGNQWRWLPARLVHRDGGVSEEVASKDPAPVKLEKPYKLVFRVQARKITGSVNNRAIGSADKPPEVFGVVAFRARNWSSFIIDGQVEPSWIQSKIDDVVQKNLATFRTQYDPSAYLPDWMVEAAADASSSVAAEGSRWPDDVDPTHYETLDEIERVIERGNALLALVKLQEVMRKDVPPSALSYLRALLHFRMYQLPGALQEVDGCLTIAPEFLSALLLKARILSRMGHGDEALAVFDAARERHPRSPEVCEQAVLHLLRAGRLETAEKAFRRAAENRVTSEDLDALGRALVKASSGPSWTRVYDYESANYHVFSDIDLSTCRKAANTLEEAHRAYQSALKRVRRDGSQRFKVYLFRGQAGFTTYMKDLGTLGGDVHMNVAGVYSPLLKQLLIWNLPNREMMLRTVRHEGLHQYLDRFLPFIPPWFNEGLAEYYEHGHRVAGRLYFGRVNGDYVKMLENQAPVPLEVFLHLSRREFYRGGIQSYAQAWAFMHMLRNGGARWQKLFKQLLADLETLPPHQALANAFGDMDLKALDEEFRAHLTKLAEDGS